MTAQCECPCHRHYSGDKIYCACNCKQQNAFQNYLFSLTGKFLIERIEKLEDYMKIEDRITASSVLIRLSQIEETLNDLQVFKTVLLNIQHKCPLCGSNKGIP